MSAGLPPNFFDSTATVYARPSGGTAAFSDALKVREGLACRLIMNRSTGLRVGPDRAVQTEGPALDWEGAYAMPEGSQVVLTATPPPDLVGSRWNTIPGSFEAFADWTNTVIYRTANVERLRT
jgi:hypothetical protein